MTCHSRQSGTRCQLASLHLGEHKALAPSSFGQVVIGWDNRNRRIAQRLTIWALALVLPGAMMLGSYLTSLIH